MQIEKVTMGSNGPNEIFNKLIPIYDTKHGKMINARELHFALGVKKKFADWIKAYTKNCSGYHYGQSNVGPDHPEEYDYFTYEIPATQGAGKKIEYLLTINRAKEIAMMTRSVMGKEIRKYFIEAEKTLNEVQAVLTSTEKTPEEKIADALLLSQQLVAQKEKELKNAIRNKEYNKKVNVRLRKEIKELKSELNDLKKNGLINIDSQRLLLEKDERIDYLEGSLERAEDQREQLKAQLKKFRQIRSDGVSLLDSFAKADIQRRLRFTFGNDKVKEKTRINAYSFRKDAILDAGIILNEGKGTKMTENISVEDVPKAVEVYMAALKTLINDDEVYNEVFKKQLECADKYLKRVQFENNCTKEEQEITQEISEDDIIF